MEFNLADLFEHAVDTWRPRVPGGRRRRRTYAEMDARANRLAHHLADQGIGPGDHVGIYGVNSVEWIESLWAIFKLRAVWININYRYVEDELAYLFGNADLKALVHDAAFTDRVDGVLATCPTCATGSSSAATSRTPWPRGRPSGTSPPVGRRPLHPLHGRHHRHAQGRRVAPRGRAVRARRRHRHPHRRPGDAPEDLVDRGKKMGFALTFLPIAPLMHGATQWAVMGQSFLGHKVVLMGQFDPHEVWRLVEEERANSMMMTGDAMARPLVEALDDEPSKDRDLSSIMSLSSTAAVFSPSLKDQFLDRFPNLVITDAIGSSEGGANGIVIVEKGKTAMRGGPTVTPVEGTVVLDDDLRPVEPGSGASDGWPAAATSPRVLRRPGQDRRDIRRGGRHPVRHPRRPGHGRGRRRGDAARPRLAVDQLRRREDLPRGGRSGRQVAPGGLRRRGGGRARRTLGPAGRGGGAAPPGQTPDLASVQDHCRTKIAGYKVPRELHLVAQMQRSPSGKADYPWAKKVATGDD